MTQDARAEQKSEQPNSQTLGPALQRRLQQCFEHATKLLQQEHCDYDYVHSLFAECVVKDPGNVTYLEAMLQSLHRKYKNNKRGALVPGFGGAKGAFKKALAKKDWAEALRLGPEVLKNNPWDVPTLRGLADACAAGGHHEAELRYLKSALEAKPRDPQVNRHCARSLARVGQFDQAITCWSRVDEVLRGDDEAQRMIGELQIEKTRQRAGMTTDEHRSPAARRQAGDAHVAQAKSPDPPPRKDLQLTARQKLEQQIVSNLADLEAYLELAQLHVAEERLGEAAHVLHKALAAAPEDPLVRERLEDVDILRKKRQLAQAEKRTASEPGEEAQQAVQKLRSELNQLEWETYHNRSQRRPEDREIKFQLGMRLKRLERIPEAMQCFEAAWHSPERRASASLELGECWQRLKQYGKALECYQRSANECKEDQRELKKLGLYRAGILASGLQNLDAAERSLAELLEMDPDFRDAATRLDKIRQIRDKH